jgi:hypothetical protein
MDILHQAGVAIDDFRKPYHPLSLLTHAHSDSRRGKIPDGVVCHREVVSDLRAVAPEVKTEPCSHFVVLEDKGPPVVPFPTQHCCGSTGFWFPQQAVLYIGDGRVDRKLLRTVDRLLQTWPPHDRHLEHLHVVGDGLFHRYPRKGFFPSLDTVAVFVREMVAEWLQPMLFSCLNTSHLFFLRNFVDEREPVGWGEPSRWTKPEMKAMVLEMLRKKKKLPSKVHAIPSTSIRSIPAEEFVPLPMCAKAFRRLVPDGGFTKQVTLLATAMWFVVYQHDPGLVYWHAPSGTLRVCLSFHADHRETELLLSRTRRALPLGTNVIFSACHTRPLIRSEQQNKQKKTLH